MNNESLDSSESRLDNAALPGSAGVSPAISSDKPEILPATRRRSQAVHPLTDGSAAFADILILCDGTIFVHNLTPAMAAVLNAINPNDQTIEARALSAAT